MSQGHYYQQEAGVSYQTIEKEAKPILFCGIDITSWFFSSKHQKEEDIQFTNNDGEEYDKVEQPYQEEYTHEENETAIQETKDSYWNIAKIVVIFIGMGTLFGLFSV
jgi:hypothetical protein